ncbi:MAG: HEAT repeat domain-containing protein [Candidatus Sulfotelmatobacter sp.]
MGYPPAIVTPLKWITWQGGIVMRSATLASIAILVVSTICSGQQAQSTDTDVAAALGKLHSREWTERARAYERLRSDRGVDGEESVRAALFDLLDLENSFIESTLRESHDQVGASAKYGEGYGEYYTRLLGTVSSIADWKNPRQLCMLAHGSYDPESVFASEIATKGDGSLVQCLTQMYGSDVGLTRAKAASLLVQIFEKNNLASGTSESIHQIIMHSLHDPSEAVRIDTVHALGSFGGEDMIPALREVAETDPSPEVQGSSIRKEATRAIAAIEKKQGRK